MAGVRLPRGLEALPELFARVGDFARAQGLAADREKTLALVAEELFTNLVRHNRGGGTHIECGLRREGTRVVLRLADRDVEPFDESSIPAPLTREGEGGLGVHIVRRLTERLTYDWAAGVMTVTAVLRAEDGDVQHHQG